MKINTELIKRCCSKNLLPSGDSNDHLTRVTHLFLQEQHISKIENLDICKSLVALYLYDNKIETIENLEDLSQLACLYLQNNVITSIQNLETLTQITVLNLSRNCINLVEGLANLWELKELYIEYQKLPQDQQLEFEESSILAIAETLRIFNVSGNNLKSLIPLRKLRLLEIFSAEDNKLDDLQLLVDVVGNWSYIRIMKLNDNRVCGIPKYRDNMTVNCLELEELDGKEIPPTNREYLLNYRQHQELQGRKRESYALLRPFLEARICQWMPNFSDLTSRFTKMNIDFLHNGQNFIQSCRRKFHFTVGRWFSGTSDDNKNLNQIFQCSHCGTRCPVDTDTHVKLVDGFQDAKVDTSWSNQNNSNICPLVSSQCSQTLNSEGFTTSSIFSTSQCCQNVLNLDNSRSSLNLSDNYDRGTSQPDETAIPISHQDIFSNHKFVSSGDNQLGVAACETFPPVAQDSGSLNAFQQLLTFMEEPMINATASTEINHQMEDASDEITIIHEFLVSPRKRKKEDQLSIKADKNTNDPPRSKTRNSTKRVKMEDLRECPYPIRSRRKSLFNNPD